MNLTAIRATVAAAVLAVLAGVGLAAPAPAAPAAATNAPGGMHRFVATIGGLDPGVHTNWVRLASYSFSSTNEVWESHWHWSQRVRVVRAYTGVRAAGCVARNCIVQTAGGFQSTSAPEQLHGRYVVNGSVLRVTWDNGMWEEWTVSRPLGGALAKLSFRRTSFGATHGFGYGSNAEWDTRASMPQVAAADHTRFRHTYHLWKTDPNRVPYIDHGSGAPFWVTNWSVCDGGQCLGHRNVGQHPTEYYLSRPNTVSAGRRDTLWHWWTQHAIDRGEYCYTGGSHVKPLMQIIDDAGRFHGWVGVEGSLNQSAPEQGTSADDIGVFVISDV